MGTVTSIRERECPYHTLGVTTYSVIVSYYKCGFRERIFRHRSQSVTDCPAVASLSMCVPTLNRCPTIYVGCLDLSAYLKLSGAPGIWPLRLHLVYIQTSGSSDMPYMICDVL